MRSAKLRVCRLCRPRQTLEPLNSMMRCERKLFTSAHNRGSCETAHTSLLNVVSNDENKHACKLTSLEPTWGLDGPADAAQGVVRQVLLVTSFMPYKAHPATPGPPGPGTPRQPFFKPPGVRLLD